MDLYARYKDTELCALVDSSVEKLKELDSAATRLRLDLVKMSTELSRRGIRKAIGEEEIAE